MPTITQKLVLDDVVKFIAHPAFNIDVLTISNGDIALAVGDSILGKLVFWTGSVWKIIDSADTLETDGTAVTTDVLAERSIVGVIVDTRKILTAVTADQAGFLTDCPVLRRGPALVHGDNLFYDEQTAADVNALLLEQGIKVVDETGLALNYDLI